jgi:hypothetical protein
MGYIEGILPVVTLVVANELLPFLIFYLPILGFMEIINGILNISNIPFDGLYMKYLY